VFLEKGEWVESDRRLLLWVNSETGAVLLTNQEKGYSYKFSSYSFSSLLDTTLPPEGIHVCGVYSVESLFRRPGNYILTLTVLGKIAETRVVITNN
jgi:hypothetical protein